MLAGNAHTMIVNTPINVARAMGTIHNPVVPLVCLASNYHNNQFSSFCPLPDHVISPINVATLNRFLTNHPDRHLVNFPLVIMAQLHRDNVVICCLPAIVQRLYLLLY